MLKNLVLTEPSGTRVGDTHVRLSAGQDETHHEHLHAVRHERQPEHEEQLPLEPPVAALLHDQLVLLGELLLVRLPLVLQLLLALQAVRDRLAQSHLTVPLLAVVVGRHALVLPLVDLIFVVVALGGVAGGPVLVVGCVVGVATVLLSVAAVVVLVFVLVLEAVVAAMSRVFVRGSINGFAQIFGSVPLGFFSDVLGTFNQGSPVVMCFIHLGTRKSGAESLLIQLC